MSRRARGAVLAMAAFACAPVAGCGDDDTSRYNAYVEKVNTAQTEFAATVRRISTAITPTSTAVQDRRTLTRFEGAVDDVVADLRGIEVPAQVDAEHARLVTAISGFGDDVARANTALHRPSRRTLRQAQLAIGRATTTVNARITAAIRAINRKLEA